MYRNKSGVGSLTQPNGHGSSEKYPVESSALPMPTISVDWTLATRKEPDYTTWLQAARYMYHE
ncbi:hypothetical protein DPMN_044987 [Dreissena polymorpha]|uniref:Uncharacterized protein n=1 Tax=Dreissena polymorpha TaxID=45954 RepID=A0A9D4HZB1_DREPO|nr:hypothetical protein DPMN_044987 [Dreissena polymorpha]